MAWRWRKSIGLGKLVRVNLSRRGAGVSVGVPGARVGTGTRGAYTSVGIPGTGLYKLTRLGAKRTTSPPPLPNSSIPSIPSIESILRFVVVVAFLLLAAFVVIGLAGCGQQPKAQAIAVIPAPAPAPEKAEPHILVPGLYYQSSAPFRLLPAMSNLDTVKDAAMPVPGGGVFLFKGGDDSFGGEWWSATVTDGYGNPKDGYIDANALINARIVPYVQPVNASEEIARAPKPSQMWGQQKQAPDTIVFISTSGQGKRYHTNPNCPSLSRSGKKSIPRSQATGYSLCGQCAR